MSGMKENLDILKKNLPGESDRLDKLFKEDVYGKFVPEDSSNDLNEEKDEVIEDSDDVLDEVNTDNVIDGELFNSVSDVSDSSFGDSDKGEDEEGEITPFDEFENDFNESFEEISRRLSDNYDGEKRNFAEEVGNGVRAIDDEKHRSEVILSSIDEIDDEDFEDTIDSFLDSPVVEKEREKKKKEERVDVIGEIKLKDDDVISLEDAKEIFANVQKNEDVNLKKPKENRALNIASFEPKSSLRLSVLLEICKAFNEGQVSKDKFDLLLLAFIDGISSDFDRREELLEKRLEIEKEKLNCMLDLLHCFNHFSDLIEQSQLKFTKEEKKDKKEELK